MADYYLQIVSPERVEYEGTVESLIAPGEEGYFGVLANHAPMLSTLGEGALIVRPTGARESRHQISGGFLEVHRNKVVVLVRHIETPATV